MAKFHIPTLSAGRDPALESALRGCETVAGDVVDLDDVTLAALLNRFPKEPRLLHGLGDVVERIVKPVAVAFGMDCLDDRNRLKSGTPCARRRDALNRAFPLH
jgi:hypothetical protein